LEKKWRKTFLEYAKFSEHRKKVLKALKEIEKYPSNQSFVMYSGGKDSLVVLDLMSRVFDVINIWHFDWGRQLLPEFIEKEILKILKSYSVKKVIRQLNTKQDVSNSSLPDILFFSTLRDDIRKNNWKYLFSSLRAEESNRRKRMTRKNRQWMGVEDIFLIRDWTWIDVWSYIISKNISYLSHYDRYGEIVGWDKVRISTFFDEYLKQQYGIGNLDGILMWRYRHGKY